MTEMPKIPLLTNVAATGSYVNIPSGKWQFQLAGTVGGATIAVVVKGPDGVTDLATGISFTAAGVQTVAGGIPAGKYKATVTGGAPAGLYLTAFHIPE